MDVPVHVPAEACAEVEEADENQGQGEQPQPSGEKSDQHCPLDSDYDSFDDDNEDEAVFSDCDME